MLLTKWQTTLEGVAIEFERSLRGTHHVHVQLLITRLRRTGKLEVKTLAS